MTDHGYTSHGHSLPGKTQHPENRPEVVNCGGPIICKQCRQEVKTAMKEMFKPGSSEETTEDHDQDLEDFPNIEIQCDEEYETGSGAWERCTRDSEIIVTLAHFADQCEPQTIALCHHHSAVVQHNLRFMKAKFMMNPGPALCRYCGEPITPEDVGRITRL